MRDDIIAAFENARTNATSTGQVYWHTLIQFPAVRFGFDPNDDYFFLAMAPSNGPQTEWEQITSIFEKRRAGIPGLPTNFNSSLCLRFNSNLILQNKNITDFFVDLISGLDTSNINTSFESIMEEWESMFSMFGTTLSASEVRGLIGELIVLGHLLENQGQTAANTWVGPTGALHDFESNHWHIEVKTSLRPDPIANIHPIEQLEPIDIPFNLLIVKLRRDDSGFNLPELIENIREKIGPSNVSYSYFEDVLFASGYRDNESANYIDTRFSTDFVQRLPINQSANVLHRDRIASNVNFADIRWKLRMSEHDFLPVDNSFWENPV